VQSIIVNLRQHCQFSGEVLWFQSGPFLMFLGATVFPFKRRQPQALGWTGL
jgi:hypothetical protein